MPLVIRVKSLLFSRNGRHGLESRVPPGRSTSYLIHTRRSCRRPLLFEPHVQSEEQRSKWLASLALTMGEHRLLAREDMPEEDLLASRSQRTLFDRIRWRSARSRRESARGERSSSLPATFVASAAGTDDSSESTLVAGSGEGTQGSTRSGPSAEDGDGDRDTR